MKKNLMWLVQAGQVLTGIAFFASMIVGVCIAGDFAGDYLPHPGAKDETSILLLPVGISCWLLIYAIAYRSPASVVLSTIIWGLIGWVISLETHYIYIVVVAAIVWVIIPAIFGGVMKLLNMAEVRLTGKSSLNL